MGCPKRCLAYQRLAIKQIRGSVGRRLQLCLWTRQQSGSLTIEYENCVFVPAGKHKQRDLPPDCEPKYVGLIARLLLLRAYVVSLGRCRDCGSALLVF